MALYDTTYRPAVAYDGVEENLENVFFAARDSEIYEALDGRPLGSDDDNIEFEVPGTLMNHSQSSSILFSGVTGVFGLGGKVLSTGRKLFMQQRQCIRMGEGPTLLRLLCFLGGFAMVVSSSLSMINFFTFLTSPSAYVLQAYQGFFGIIIMIVEAKDWDCFDQFKPWLVEWFRFLTVPAGKGAFYIFVGSLGVSLWVRNFLAFTIGLYMSAIGLICIAVHAGTTHKATVSNISRHPDDNVDSYGLRDQDLVGDALANAFHDPDPTLDDNCHDANCRNSRHITTSTSASGATSVCIPGKLTSWQNGRGHNKQGRGSEGSPTSNMMLH